MNDAAGPGAPPPRRPRWGRRLVAVAGLVAALYLVQTTGWFSAFGGTPHGDRLKRMKRSPQYADGRFKNPIPTPVGPSGALWGALSRWVSSAVAGPASPSPQAVATVGLDPLPAPPETRLGITWLGHSTVLVEMEGRRVLTDPVWSHRASPSTAIGPKRFQRNPLPLDRIPRLDAVVISHDHYDHLDERAVRSIALSGVPFYVPLGVGAHLEKWGIDAKQIRELDWWEQAELAAGGLTLVATPSRHFSGRGMLDLNDTQWASWVLWGRNHRVFFSGDTGMFPGLATIGGDYGPFDVALIDVGGHASGGPEVHLTPERAVEAAEMLEARALVPIHWGTFGLGRAERDEPVRRVIAAGAERGVRVIAPRLGRTFDPAAMSLADSR